MIESVPDPVRLKPGEEFVVPDVVDEAYPRSCVAAALKLLLGLDAPDFCVLQARYRGLTTMEIAAKLGYGRRKVEYVLTRLRVANPVLAALFPRKFRKGARAMI